MFRRILPALLLLSCRPLCGDDFQTLEGLTVTSAVLPGLVQHPVMAALDDRGRLFVAENAGRNLNKEELLKELPNSIKLLKDTNGDGVFDKATVFADKLTFPQGALWVYDSLYVMSPPSLWRFADEDGDGVAEVREELVTGFDFTGNAADVHGPFLHPNGRLYWCHGRKGFAVPDNDTGEIMEEGKGARIWSSQLSGGEVESFAGGGMDNPVEVDFTDEGEIVGTVNLFYGRPRGDTLTHWVHGGVYPRFDQGQVLGEFRRTGELLPPVHDFGHVAVSGMCRYRSGLLDPEWKDGWIVTHFNTSDLTLTRFAEKGASFASLDNRTILRVLKPDAHLTDALEDHNGDLLVVDTGGWFRNGCPTSQIAKPEVAGGIYRLSREAAGPYRAPVYPNWESLTSEQVSHFLGGDEHWLRERAITELAVRGAPAMPELERILESGTATVAARKDAVWTLARMKFSESTDLIYNALTDIDPGVRHAACNAISVTRTWQIVAANQPAEREIELERNRTISGALAGIVRGDDAPVARAAAAALGRMGEHRAIGAILGRLGRAGDDRFLEHSLIYALIEIDDFDTTVEGLQSGNPQQTGGVLHALDEMASSRLEVLDVLPFLEDEDARLRETALSIATKHREWDAAIANAFFEWRGEFNEVRRGILSALVPTFADTPPVLSYLTSLMTSGMREREILGLELIALATGTPFEDPWGPVMEAELAESSDPAVLELVLRAVLATGTDRFDAALEALCGDSESPYSIRLAAAQARERAGATISGPAFELLVKILAEETDVDLRSRSLAILSQAKLEREHRDRIAPLLKTFSPVEWSAFLNLFKKIDSPEQADAVANALAASAAMENLEEEKLATLFGDYPEAMALIERRQKDIEESRKGRSARIEALLERGTEANATEGAAVFASGKGACVVCHRAGELGGLIGPDLSTIGRIRSARDLYEAILFPNESIARDFETFEVHLKNGGSAAHIGLIESQSSEGFDLVAPGGQSQKIRHQDVARIKRIPVSLMPMGLEDTMTPEELRDLVAWMLEQR